MKQVPTLLLSVVITFAAIVVYDQVRGTDAAGPPPSRDVAALDAIDSLETRLAKLEASLRPGPRGGDTDPRILERLNDFDRRLSAVTASLAGKAPAPAPAPAVGGEPSPEAVKSFRKLADTVREQERNNRNRRRIDDVLTDLRISLTEEQRAQLVQACGAFEGRRNEIWREAKTSASDAGLPVDWDAVITATTDVIRRELTDRISGFIHATEAEAISSRLNSK